MRINDDDHYIEKENAISIIRILADKMADENIDVAAEQFILAIQGAFETDAIYELREKLRKERKKKKRWKNKYLNLIVNFNLLRDSYAELQSMYSELRIKYGLDKDNIDE